MRRTLFLILAVLVAMTGLIASPAQAGRYGHRLAHDSASGDWLDMPAASASGTVRHPTSFTVRVKGTPRPGYLCASNPYGCKERMAIWDVACKGHGRVVSRQGAAQREGTVTAHPRLPMHDPKRCSISAGGSLSYGAGGRVQVTIYYRN